MRHRRSEFSAATMREAFERSRGICECHRVPMLKRPNGCGVKLAPGNTFYEHICSSWHSSDNTIENCAALTKTCWREKTDRHDKPSIAKSKRLIDHERGIHNAPTLPGSRRDPFKRTISGAVVDRATGEPWGTRR